MVGRQVLGRITLGAMLYLNYAAMLVLGFVFLRAAAFGVVPTISSGSMPSRQMILPLVVVPPVMLALAALLYAPEALRRARRRPAGEGVLLATGAAAGYLKVLVLALGINAVLIIGGLPVLIVYYLLHR